MSVVSRQLDRRLLRAIEVAQVAAPQRAEVIATDETGSRRSLLIVAYTVSGRGGEAHVLLPDGGTAPVSALGELGVTFVGVQIAAPSPPPPIVDASAP